MDRRTFLAGSLLAPVALAVRGAPRAWATPKAGLRWPYLFEVMVGGGLDAIYTMDPKTRAKVDSSVDLPYPSRGIVSAGNYGLGPHMASMAKHGGSMAILRGVRTKSLSHAPALRQLLCLRLGISTRNHFPSFNDIVGLHRGEQPLNTVTFDTVTSGMQFMASPSSLSGELLFDDLLHRPAEELAAMAAGLRAQADTLARRSSGQSATTVENLRSTARFVERAHELPPFKLQKWSDDDNQQWHAIRFQKVLWLFENDLTCAATYFHYAWDTHTENATLQTAGSLGFFPMFARFLDELKTRKNHRGVLADNTNIVAGSELGRHPVLNKLNGKHHFPENCFMVSGPAFKTGHAYGETKRMMEARPVALTTGKPVQNGHFMDMDDLGATILSALGIQGEKYGYAGRVLSFLV